MKMDVPPIDPSNDSMAPIDDVALRFNRRDSMFVKASVQCERIQHAFDVVVRNVSAGGMLVDTKLDLLNGDRVKVLLAPIGEVPGRIVWVQPGRFGVAFDVTINPQMVRKPVNVRSAPAGDAVPVTRFVSRLHGKPITRP